MSRQSLRPRRPSRRPRVRSRAAANFHQSQPLARENSPCSRALGMSTRLTFTKPCECRLACTAQAHMRGNHQQRHSSPAATGCVFVASMCSFSLRCSRAVQRNAPGFACAETILPSTLEHHLCEGHENRSDSAATHLHVQTCASCPPISLSGAIADAHMSFDISLACHFHPVMCGRLTCPF